MFNFAQQTLNKTTMSTREFTNLIVAQQSFLNQLAFKLTRSSEDAADLLQDTVFKALKNKDKYQEGTNLKGWLYTIMRNTFINNYRKKKNQNTFIDDSENKYFINSKEADKESYTDAGVDREYMMKQIESVDRHYVETFMMYYNGYKYEEIAEMLHIPLGTVKSRIFLARRKLMDKLKDLRN